MDRGDVFVIRYPLQVIRNIDHKRPLNRLGVNPLPLPVQHLKSTIGVLPQHREELEIGLGQVQRQGKRPHKLPRQCQTGTPVPHHRRLEVRDAPGLAPRKPAILTALGPVGLEPDVPADVLGDTRQVSHSRVAAWIVGPRKGLAVVDALGGVDALRLGRLVPIVTCLVGRTGDGGGDAVVLDVEEAVVGRRVVDLPCHGEAVLERCAEDARDVDDGDFVGGGVPEGGPEHGPVHGAVAGGELELEGLNLVI
ncbi:hypothetical protein VP1G_10507 [Cytospora mali]|uniref:Uncharacterized protein n=1 Tax=Cytospora mali TaxID=578113 RepID=A0A194ULT3_CYTMA|nr:hypothetical protein VP1G_10507 [Valsa mali var. pyri (nom. inval.)]